MIRVLFTTPNLTTAGSGRALFEVARRLDRRRFEPTLGVQRLGGSLQADFEAAGIPVLDLSVAGGPTVAARPLWSLWPRARRAGREIRRRYGRFDVWHSYHYLDDYTEPLVARAAGARAWIYTKKNMSWNRRSWWLRSALATRIAAQNRDMLDTFFTGRLRHKTVHLPRGVDTERFTPDGAIDDELRAWAGDAPLIVCVAHLVPVKGQSTLIAALRQLPDARLALAGRADDADYAAALEWQIEDAGLSDRVRLLGAVDEVPSLLRTADISVLPTLGRDRMEGCPVAVLEAMATARAVVVTEIAGSRDLVVDGGSGRVVPPDDHMALAAVLGELAADPEQRRRLGEAARWRVDEHYAITREAHDHERLYDEALDGSGRSST